MAQKSIIWTETAVKQRREILKYWTKRNDSLAYAEKLIYLIAKQVRIFLDIPNHSKRLIYQTKEDQLWVILASTIK